MLEGHPYLERDSPEHEPQISGTRICVSWIAEALKNGDSIDDLLNYYKGIVNKNVLEDAVSYAREKPEEMHNYIQERHAGAEIMMRRAGKELRVFGDPAKLFGPNYADELQEEGFTIKRISSEKELFD